MGFEEYIQFGTVGGGEEWEGIFQTWVKKKKKKIDKGSEIVRYRE